MNGSQWNEYRGMSTALAKTNKLGKVAWQRLHDSTVPNTVLQSCRKWTFLGVKFKEFAPKMPHYKCSYDLKYAAISQFCGLYIKKYPRNRRIFWKYCHWQASSLKGDIVIDKFSFMSSFYDKRNIFSSKNSFPDKTLFRARPTGREH